MEMTLSYFFSELARYTLARSEPILSHICRMAALEAQAKDIPAPPLGWTIVGMWDWNAVDDINHLDEKCAELFGVDPLEARQGMSTNAYLKAVHPDDAPRLAATIMEALKNGGPFESRYRVISNGRVRHILARGVCTLDKSGRAERFPGVILEAPNFAN